MWSSRPIHETIWMGKQHPPQNQPRADARQEGFVPALNNLRKAERVPAIFIMWSCRKLGCTAESPYVHSTRAVNASPMPVDFFSFYRAPGPLCNGDLTKITRERLLLF
ncbi:unnamed protein product, partial [Ectocarpus fasciculatus]